MSFICNFYDTEKCFTDCFCFSLFYQNDEPNCYSTRRLHLSFPLLHQVPLEMLISSFFKSLISNCHQLISPSVTLKLFNFSVLFSFPYLPLFPICFVSAPISYCTSPFSQSLYNVSPIIILCLFHYPFENLSSFFPHNLRSSHKYTHNPLLSITKISQFQQVFQQTFIWKPFQSCSNTHLRISAIAQIWKRPIKEESRVEKEMGRASWGK